MSTSPMRHTHPANLLLLMPKFLVLLLIPLIRSLVVIFTSSFRAWLVVAWVDAATSIALLSFIVLRWYCVTYRFDEGGVAYTRGIIFRRASFIPTASISTVGREAHFIFKPLGVVQIRADSVAGKRGELDFSLLIKKSEAQVIFSDRLRRHYENPQQVYIPDGKSVVLLSLITSNSFAGLLLMVTFISQFGELLGRELSQYFVDTFNNIGRALAFGIPPAAAFVGYLLLFSWLIAFISEFIRNKNFALERSTHDITIRRGVFTNRSYATNISAISLVDIRQTVFAALFGYCAVFVHAVGFNPKTKDDAAIIPAQKKPKALRLVAQLLPEFPLTQRELKPNYGALFRFIADPLYFCAGIPIVGIIVVYFLPAWKAFVIFAGIMGMFPAVWFLAVRLIDYFTGGISRDDDVFTMRYSSGFYLHTVIFPLDKVANICTRQSVFQMMDKRCDLFIYTYGQTTSKHRCRNLHKEEIKAFFGI